jgi:hypothetical protein
MDGAAVEAEELGERAGAAEAGENGGGGFNRGHAG